MVVYGADALQAKFEPLKAKDPAATPPPSANDLEPFAQFAHLATPEMKTWMSKCNAEILKKHGFEKARQAERRVKARTDQEKAMTNKEAAVKVERDKDRDALVDTWAS